jgi:hypothetical protein
MKRLTNAEKAELHKKLEEAEKAKFKPYENKIAELEKENAELKTDMATAIPLLERAKEISESLIKAKEIIKNLMVFAEMDDREYEKEYKEAEQFLKEE